MSSTLWKQREDYCASLIQKAWKFHKLRNTESACTEEHLTGDEDDEAPSSSSQHRGGHGQARAALRSPKSPVPAAPAAPAAAKAAEMDPSGSGLPHPSRLPPVDSKHLIEVKCAVEEKSELKDLFEKDEEEKKKKKQ